MATYQTVTEKDRLVIAPHVERARRTLAAAEALAAAGFAADCVARAHQATVHGERALLATEKRSPPDARSVHRLATLHFHQGRVLGTDHLPALERLGVARAAVDDQPLGDATGDAAAEALGTARAFLDDVAAWLTSVGHLAAKGASA